jgi:tetratricopeptide (TPR) repeat protein
MTTPPGFGIKPDPATALLRDVNYVISAAKEIRGMSDMQQALELLRKADELNPDHPAIIAEMAQTYEQMGLTAKATDSWRRIQLLGATKAGSYFELAARRLGSGSAAVTAPGLSAASGAESEKFLRLGACHVGRDFTVNAGERYVLRVPIARAGNRPINSQELNLEVFFFDRVNNAKVALTIAPEPVETWQSAPVDWNGTGEELLDVVYHLPALSPTEIQQHGRRTYYGYMLRLYYNNKLQDVAAEPRDLLEFGSAPGAAPGGVNPLLPPMGK